MSDSPPTTPATVWRKSSATLQTPVAPGGEDRPPINPLHEAVHRGDRAAVRRLLARGYPPDAKGFRPLFYALRRNDVPIVRLLLASGAHVRARLDDDVLNWSSIHLAAHRCSLTMVKLLVKHGANPRQKSNRCGEPLHCAAFWGKLPTVRWLLDHGTPPDAPGVEQRTALHFAAAGNYFALARLLLVRGADVNAVSREGMRPYDEAACRERWAMAKLLTKHGGKPMERPAKSGPKHSSIPLRQSP